MRITIVKNDDFKTIGLHVETTNPGYFIPERVFSHGISASGFNYSKTVSGDHYEKEVFALVCADKEAEAARNIMREINKAVMDGGLKVERNEDGSYLLGSNDYYKGIIERAEKNLARRMQELEEAIANHNKK